MDKRLRAYQLKLATRRSDELPHLKQNLKAVEDEINRVVAKVAEATISDEDAKGMLTDLRRDKEHYLAKIEEITGGPLRFPHHPGHVQAVAGTSHRYREQRRPRDKRGFLRRFIHKHRPTG